MSGPGLLVILDDWRTRFLRDPAGFIDAMAEPWRTLGLLELTAGAWLTRPWHAKARPHWRLAEVETPAIAIARAVDGTFLAATESAPGAPGLLRLSAPAASVEAYAYGDGRPVAAHAAPWNGWSAFRAARRCGATRTAALQRAWPPAGPRFIKGGIQPYLDPTPDDYRAWLADPANRPAPRPLGRIRFAIALDGDADSPGGQASLASLQAQTWPHWRIAASGGPGEAMLTLAVGDTLLPEALAALAEAFDDPAVQAVYADEDRQGPDGPTDPVFKTALDAERLRTQDYVGAALAARSETVRAAGGLDARRLAAASPAGGLRHLPRVLFRRAAPAAWPVEAVARRLPDPPPRVLAVVPTRDRPALLRGAVEGLLHRTAYPGLEVAIVDNGSQDPATLALMETLAAAPRCRVLRIDGPFDYPALNNAAAAGSDAEVLAFVNDDTWVIEPGWLDEMVALALRDDVGAVGAKLFYADGRIQHAGVALGLGMQGVAGHPFKGAPSILAGPQGMLQVVREVSAVTGACLVVERRKFEAVGGFDSSFKVAFNDVDLCLRLAAHGWRSVWTPHARMVHLEGATRGRDLSGERAARLAGEAERMHARWGAHLAEDPFYHPALYLKGERWALAPRPRSWSLR